MKYSLLYITIGFFALMALKFKLSKNVTINEEDKRYFPKPEELGYSFVEKFEGRKIYQKDGLYYIKKKRRNASVRKNTHPMLLTGNKNVRYYKDIKHARNAISNFYRYSY